MNTIETSRVTFAQAKMRMQKLARQHQMLHFKWINSGALLIAASLLAGCQHQSEMDTTGQGRGKTYRQITCVPFKALGYDSEKDTPLTVRGIQVHNQTGRNLRCWK